MNKKICKKIIEHKERFIPSIFTRRQLEIMEKYLNGEALRRSEKTVLYSVIRQKGDALAALQEEWHIRGEGMIPERVEEAKNILRSVNAPAFISGSFLYAQHYNDIDIYLLSKRRKQHHEGKNHFICITEADLRKPLFSSVAKYSVSNCFLGAEAPHIQRPMFNDLVVTYELAINEILDNDDQKEVRTLLFEYAIQVNGLIPDSYSLSKQFQEIKNLDKDRRIARINQMAKAMLLWLYSARYLYNELMQFLKRLKIHMKEYHSSENLPIYYQLLTEVKNESRRAEA